MKMDKIIIGKELLERVLKDAFNRGALYGKSYGKPGHTHSIEEAWELSGILEEIEEIEER